MHSRTRRTLVAALAAAAALTMLTAPCHAGWLAGWDYRQEISVNPSVTPGDLTAFPLLVKIADTGNDVFGNAASPAGLDVVFTKANGVTMLPREIERYDTGAGQLEAWVKTDVSSAAPTKLYMYYKGADVPNSAAAWDSSFKMVQHLQETSGTHFDSTSHGNDGTVTGANMNALGKIDGADSFDSSGHHVEIADSASLRVSDGTWEAWIKPTSLSGYRTVMAKGYRSDWWFGLYNNTGQIQLWTSNVAQRSVPAVNNNQWSHIAATFDDAADEIKYYINGQHVDSDTQTAAPILGTAGAHIGADYTDGASGPLSYWFRGTVDEVRLSDTARTDEWIEATYNNLNDPTGCVTAGAPQDNEWLPGWRYRQPITLSSAAADADLDDFPVLIKIDDAGNRVFVNANSLEGHDIVFTRSDGVNLLPHEIEYYNNAGELDAWVKASLSATEDTTIYMYYGGPDADDPHDTDTWNANYKMVQHLQENPSAGAPQMTDSTKFNNNGTCQGSLNATDQVPGQIDGSVDFDGSSDHVDLGDNGSLDVGHGTWEAWVYPTSFTDHPYHTVAAKDYSTGWWFGLYGSTGKIQLWAGGTPQWSTGAVPLNQWSHIAATWDGSVQKFYINGQLDSQFAHARSVVTNDYAAYIGIDYARHPTDYEFTGQLDEIRISDIAHSAEWIAASYNFQDPWDGLLTFGEEQIPEPATLTLLALGALALLRRRRR